MAKVNMKQIIFLLFQFLSFSIVYGTITIKSETEALNFAMENSKELLYGKLLVIQEMETSALSIQNFLPSFNFSFSESANISIYGNDSRSKNLSISINQLIFDGGNVLNEYRFNRLQSLYNFENYNLQLRFFISNVIESYYGILTQQEIIKIKKQVVKNGELNLKIIEKEKEIGRILEIDYLDYLISYNKLLFELEQEEKNLNKMIRSFKSLLGLNPQEQIQIEGKNLQIQELFYLEEYEQGLFPLIKANSIELKKKELEHTILEYEKQIKDRWYVPKINLQAGVAFSNTAFPLDQPEYSIKLGISFDKLTFFPGTISSGLSFSENNLSSVNNTVSSDIQKNIPVFLDKNTQKILILQSRLNLAKTEEELYVSFVDLLINHDQCIKELEFLRESISIYEKRLEFSKIELENGKIKRLDYLNKLSELAGIKITTLQKQSEVLSYERTLEIYSGIEFGGLIYECNKL